MPHTKQLWQHLDLLCKAGIGIEAIAHDLAALIRQLVGAEATAVFWLDEQGLPAGFYHEDSPASAQSLFLDEFERLFVGPNELNVFALAQHKGRRTGNLIIPPDGFALSNTLNLLIRPSGHEHTLDLRVDVDGKTRAVVLLFRAAGQPFTDADAQQMERIAPYLERAIASAQAHHHFSVLASGHILVDAQGSRVLLHSDHATTILQGVNRPGTGVCKTDTLLTPPSFVRQLCETLQRQHLAQTAMNEFAVPGGRLQAQATALYATTHGLRTDALTPAQPTQVLVELKLLRPRQLEVVRKIAGLSLSPTQQEIALLAATGRRRSDCLSTVGVSKEALKKHLKAVYAAAGATDWEHLQQVLSD
jgi:DNA-binding CsgD family transcriptional regulator